MADSATGGVGVLAALAALGCAAAAGVLLTGPATPPTTRIPATPVAAVSSASPTVPDPLPPRPGQPLPTARALPAAAGVPVGAPVPGWRLALDDAASAVPNLAPLPVDPAVEEAMARLRVAAAGAAGSRRPGVAALTALDHAFDQVGDPYVWGATGPDTFDCSGLMLWSYRAAGVTLPRVSRDQFATGGEPVAVDDLLPGDLVFFATASWDPGVVHHVGMYAGSGLMVAAPRPGLTVRVEPMSAQGYVGAVRPVPARGAGDEGGRRHRAARPPATAEHRGRLRSCRDHAVAVRDVVARFFVVLVVLVVRAVNDAEPRAVRLPVVARARSGAVLVDPEPDPPATPLPTEIQATPQPTIVATLTPVVVRISVLPTVPTRGTR